MALGDFIGSLRFYPWRERMVMPREEPVERALDSGAVAEPPTLLDRERACSRRRRKELSERVQPLERPAGSRNTAASQGRAARRESSRKKAKVAAADKVTRPRAPAQEPET